MGLASSYSAEMCAMAGFDWLLIDGEHAPNNLQTIQQQLQSIAAYPVNNAIARVPVGDTALIKQYLEKSKSQETISAKDVVDRWKNGDPMATEVMVDSIEILGMSLANFVTIHSPSMIVLFGGWAQSGESTLEAIRSSFEKNVLQIYRGKVELVSSLLEGSDAALLGAASLVF